MKILIVEDCEMVQTVLSALLERLGHNTIVAQSGEEGLGMIGDDIDVIITDLSLPGMSGLEMLNTLQNNNKIPSISIVMSGNLRVDIPNWVGNTLQKPFTLTALKEVLN